LNAQGDRGGIESWRKTAMAARKKTAKRTVARGSKTPKGTIKTAAKSAKNSASRKSKAGKTLTKLEKAALAAKQKSVKTKAAAKTAKNSAAQSSAKTTAKQAAPASKMARPSVKQKIEAEAKSAAGTQSINIPPLANEAKENQELNAAKTKTEVKNPASIKAMSAAKSGASAVKGVVGGAAKPEAQAGEAARVATPAAQPAKSAAAASPVVPLQAKLARPAVAEGAPIQRAEEPAKAAKQAAPRHGFKANEFVVYPAHGVGQIVAIEEQEVAGFRLELFVITFVKDKMMLRVPVGKAASVGMRKLSDPDLVKKSLDTLLGRARIKRTMWSRRAQEYEAKINSGDLIAIAEVVRDLYRSEAQPEQSYSERQLYEAALDRMAREVAVVQKIGEGEALKVIEGQLQKGQRGRKAESAAAGEAANDADVEEAA
jgi:CarD family transcriptional regulator